MEEDYDDWYHDDGYFFDNGYDQRIDDYDIPTYDELDLEGRYYTYGSREDYNEWRNEQIQAVEQTYNQRKQRTYVTKGGNHQEQAGCLSVVILVVLSLMAFILG